MSNIKKKEYGDFQTPIELVNLVIEIIKDMNISPEIILEPTCGTGNFILQAYKVFNYPKTVGIEIDSNYCKGIIDKIENLENFKIYNIDFFKSENIIKNELNAKEKLLFIGNPPWITNSEISNIGSNNFPQKYNIKNLKGIDAITGKSNFDISEYIILKLIEWFNNKTSYFAFLCKTIVARNILKYCWLNLLLYKDASIYPIDSKRYFDASVDSCLFIIDFTDKKNKCECNVFNSIENRKLNNKLGFYNNKLISNMRAFTLNNYMGKSEYVWRNGVKHDCSKVMELDIVDNNLVNRYGEEVNIEDDLVYLLLKSSDVANGNITIRKKIIITQTRIAGDTSYIKSAYPKTWNYLQKYSNDFDNRKSSIYKNKPRFSIFSIGDYSFSLYKIAISGLYKELRFKLICPVNEKCVMVDDTCNFISCSTKSEAETVFLLLTSNEALDYLDSIIFWDSKRPITTEILNTLDINKLAKKYHIDNYYNLLLHYNKTVRENQKELTLFQ